MANVAKASLINKTAHESMYKDVPIYQEKPFLPRVISKDKFEELVTNRTQSIFKEYKKTPIVVESDLFIPISERLVTTCGSDLGGYNNWEDNLIETSYTFKTIFPSTHGPFAPFYNFNMSMSDLYRHITCASFSGNIHAYLFFVYGYTAYANKQKVYRRIDSEHSYVYLLPLNFDHLNIVLYCHTCGEVINLNTDLHDFFSRLPEAAIDTDEGDLFYKFTFDVEHKPKNSRETEPIHKCKFNNRAILIQVIGLMLEDFYKPEEKIEIEKPIELSLYDKRLFSLNTFLSLCDYQSLSNYEKKELLTSIELGTTIKTNINYYKGLYYTDVLPDELYSQKILSYYEELYPRLLISHKSIKKIRDNEFLHKFDQQSSEINKITYVRQIDISKQLYVEEE